MTTKNVSSKLQPTFNPAQAGALLALLAVAFGAFGAHALSDLVTPARLATFETGVRYQMYHALGLLLLGALPAGSQHAGWFLLTGSVIFSGSLYLLVLTNAGWFGAIAPIGGVLQLIGWGVLFVSLSRLPAQGPAKR
jgi:uncharacterized membrane protein YgdD (TMEM256/DUF423 family)